MLADLQIVCITPKVDNSHLKDGYCGLCKGSCNTRGYQQFSAEK